MSWNLSCKCKTLTWCVSNENNVSVMLCANSLPPLYNVAVMDFHTLLLTHCIFLLSLVDIIKVSNFITATLKSGSNEFPYYITDTLFSLLPLWYEIIVSEILHFSCYNFAFLTLFDFLFSQECQSCDSEVPVWIFPSHSCQKSLSKSLGFASWLGKTFLAFVTWKNPY